MIRSDEFKQGYINCTSDYKTFGIEYCKAKVEEMEQKDQSTKGYKDALNSFDKSKIRLYVRRRTRSY